MIVVASDQSQSFGLARHQGLRPTCLAFAVSDLNAFAHASDPLSVEFLCHHAAKVAVDWQPDEGFEIEHVLRAVEVPGQPTEESYPYASQVFDAPLTPPPSHITPQFASPTRARALNANDVIREALAGEAVGIIIAVTQSLYYPQGGLIDFDPNVLPELYHALIAVGVGTQPASGQRHVLVRNSWGTSWGVDGCAWIPEQHLALHLHEGFLL